MQCQIREVLHAAMPGYAECFAHPFASLVALLIARATTAVHAAGFDGCRTIVINAEARCQKETLATILAWAEQAPAAHPLNAHLRRILADLDDDRLAKIQQITALERDLAHRVVDTPYALLLAIPGINVVTIADLAGELGPMQLYLNAAAITGRAGLMPTRYQSDQVDSANGPLRRRGHRRLRAVLMQTTDNLVQWNQHFHARADLWRRADQDPRWIRVKVAKRFSRLAYAIVAGRHLFPHPCCRPRHHLIGKFLEFHADQDTPPADLRRDLETVIAPLHAPTRADEAQPLRAQLEDLAQRRRGPTPLADIIPVVLARLGTRVVESEAESERTPS